MKTAVIPIDNRPICYDVFQNLAYCDKKVQLFLPPANILGNLKKPADTDKILKWLKNLPDLDFIIVSLDTIAYGGLIPSRKSNESREAILKRVKTFCEIASQKKAKVYAFSSIMRISNNNINEEEKEYWNLYGKKIFDYSYNVHKSKVTKDYDAQCKFSCISSVIPDEILNDYLKTRERNFNVNKFYLDCGFDTLVFSKDDTGEYGFNVEEAQILEEIANGRAYVKTGADEIPLCLFARALAEHKTIKIAPVFTYPESTNLISKYEDISIFNCVNGQLELCGAESTAVDKADLVLYVNNFKFEQGDLVLGKIVNESQQNNVSGANCLNSSLLANSDKPFFIADVNNANGADNKFVEKFFLKKTDWNRFYGYAGWNTSANTLGSAIVAAILRFCAEEFDLNNFKKLQLIRFLDDWAYQANIRKEISLENISQEEPESQATKKLKKFEEILNKNFETNFSARCSFPWDRKFEVRIDVSDI